MPPNSQGQPMPLSERVQVVVVGVETHPLSEIAVTSHPPTMKPNSAEPPMLAFAPRVTLQSLEEATPRAVSPALGRAPATIGQAS